MQSRTRPDLLVLASLAAGLSTPSGWAGQYVLTHTLIDPSPSMRDCFGLSIATDGRFLIVGDPCDSPGTRGVGQAHLFDAHTGSLLHTFAPPDAIERGSFGVAVAIDSGGVLIAGANSSNRTLLFDPETHDFIRAFDGPQDAVGRSFGAALAMSARYVAIGDTAAGESSQGRALLFDRATARLLRVIDNPKPSARFLGVSVALSGDRLIAGAPGFISDPDGAFAFDLPSGALVTTLENPMELALDEFGRSVAADGALAAVGAPGGLDGAAHMFDLNSGAKLRTLESPTDSPILNDGFGQSVDLDGDRLLVGAAADGEDADGRAHLFDAGTGALLRTFDSGKTDAFWRFGESVSMRKNIIAITAASGHVFIFTCPGDLDGDGVVGSADLGLLLGDWGYDDPAADLNGDGVVDGDDVAILLGEWGVCQ